MKELFTSQLPGVVVAYLTDFDANAVWCLFASLSKAFHLHELNKNLVLSA